MRKDGGGGGGGGEAKLLLGHGDKLFREPFPVIGAKTKFSYDFPVLRVLVYRTISPC